jgi:rSAM/selenodomain-associated transferase 1
LATTDQKNAVALFVRQPIPGRVKTRLACDLGDVPACELYQAMVADCIRSASSVGLPLYLFHDGQDFGGLPQAWKDAATDVIRQVGESLGDRMAAAFEFLFSIGIEGVVLTGSDIPGVDDALLRSALVALEAHDVVFAPAFDGGYCLVASQRNGYSRLIFDDIPWSTDAVMALTVAACHAGDLSCVLLDYRQDIDTLADVQSYCRRPSPSACLTNSWLMSHGFELRTPIVDQLPHTAPGQFPAR